MPVVFHSDKSTETKVIKFALKRFAASIWLLSVLKNNNFLTPFMNIERLSCSDIRLDKCADVQRSLVYGPEVREETHFLQS